MREIQTDYLVVGAGATGMAFVDALIARSAAEVVMVDRRHGPGGHWRDAYPFVRLHQPSPCYGVDSVRLGDDRVDTTGPNAGFYERASAPEICDYYDRVLARTFLPSGQVRFLGMHDYRGEQDGGHVVTSLLSGESVSVQVRRRLVDATYLESLIPSRHTPGFAVDDDVTFMPPNDLVHLADAPEGFTVLGAGKTALDTCTWLLEQGVDPGSITWVKSREAYFFDRAFTQPLAQVGSYMQLQARWIEAAADTTGGLDFAHRLEDAEIFVRVDEELEAYAHRGATVSLGEVESLRSIENVVRRGRVRRISSEGLAFEDGTLSAGAKQVYVDCTAQGVQLTVPRPVFGPGRITPQYVTPGYACWSGASIGVVEALRDDDVEKNRLCPPNQFTGDTRDLDMFAHQSLVGLTRRGSEPDIAAWSNASRLNPAGALFDHLDDPVVTDALSRLGAFIGPAAANLERLAGAEVGAAT